MNIGSLQDGMNYYGGIIDEHARHLTEDEAFEYYQILVSIQDMVSKLSDLSDQILAR